MLICLLDCFESVLRFHECNKMWLIYFELFGKAWFFNAFSFLWPCFFLSDDARLGMFKLLSNHDQVWPVFERFSQSVFNVLFLKHMFCQFYHGITNFDDNQMYLFKAGNWLIPPLPNLIEICLPKSHFCVIQFITQVSPSLKEGRCK